MRSVCFVLMFIISHLAFGNASVSDKQYAYFLLGDLLGEESPYKVYFTKQMDIHITWERYPAPYDFIMMGDDRYVAGRLYTPNNNSDIYEEISKGNSKDSVDLIDKLIKELVIFNRKTMILAFYEVEGSKSSQTLMKCLPLD